MAVRSPPEPTTAGIRPIIVCDYQILLLDQRYLPHRVEYFDATRLDDMCFAIRNMVVRGAPAIGVAAALSLAREAMWILCKSYSTEEFIRYLAEARDKLQSTRPTAVNLAWATNHIFDLALTSAEPRLLLRANDLFERAKAMIEEDIRINMAMAEHGADLLGARCSVLTHCNTGALATCGWGTALGVIRTGHARQCELTVYVDETRPRQQGARLTAWELIEEGITPIVVTDSMAGHLMAQKRVDLVLVGADRIAANGDTANKIGTYSLAVLANSHRVPFYVVAPLSTIDPSIACGQDIPIEERDADEITSLGAVRICPEGVKVYNPAFDVTPARLITGIVTEVGILEPPYRKAIKAARKLR